MRMWRAYIMPPMPPIPPMPAGGIAGCSCGSSAITASVVKTRAAMLAAFCKAERVTLAGSTMPDLTMSSYSSVNALKPMPASAALTLSTTMEPSRPALSAIWRTGSSIARRTSCTPVRTSPSTSN